jgi:hypothetical protein
MVRALPSCCKSEDLPARQETRNSRGCEGRAESCFFKRLFFAYPFSLGKGYFFIVERRKELNMKKLLSLLLMAITLFALACCGQSNGAGKTVATVAKDENTLAITVEEVSGDVTLLALMEELQEGGEFVFEADLTGMVQSIEGKANPADWSACWMLYTSDAEMANTEWGVIEYGGVSYGSAIVGANALYVVAGATYVWSYQSFAM